MTRPRREVLGDLAARAAIGGLFTLLSINIFADFMRTGRLTGLLLLAGEVLVVVLTIARRRTQLVDRSITAVALTVLSVAGPPLLRASDVAPLAADEVTALLSAM